MESEDFLPILAIFFGVFALIMGMFLLIPDDADTFKPDCVAKHGIVKTIGDSTYCVIDGTWVKK